MAPSGADGEGDEGDEEDEGEDPEALLFGLPVMRNAIKMSEVLREAAAGGRDRGDGPGGDGRDGDGALRVGFTEIRPGLGAREGVVDLEQIVEACGEAAGALKPYQTVGVSFLTLLFRHGIPGAILADEMGLGKTVQVRAPGRPAGAARAPPRAPASHPGPARPSAPAPAPAPARDPPPPPPHPRPQLICFLGVIKHLFNDVGPHLVVCPVSLLENWEREIARWCPAMETRVLYGSRKAEFEGEVEEYLTWVRDGGVEGTGEDPPFDIALVPYTIFSSTTAGAKADRVMLHRLKWSHVVLDEAHAAKNRGSTRYKKLKALTDKARRRILMTGTPLQNSMEELHALLELIMPEVAAAVAQVVNGMEADDGLDEAVVAQVRRVLAPVLLRRLKSEVAGQLTAKEHRVERLPMTDRQRRCYEDATEGMRRRLLGAAEGPAAADRQRTFDGIDLGDARDRVRALDSKDVSNIFMHLRKVSYHPLLVRSLYGDARAAEIARLAWEDGYFGEDARCAQAEEHVRTMSDYAIHSMCLSRPGKLGQFALDRECVRDSGKMRRLAEILRELRARGSRPLVFSQWTSMLDIIADVMALEGLPFVRLDGSTAGEERQKLCDAFNAPGSELFAFLLTTRAGGTGLNLTGADTVVLHDVDFNPQQDRQAEDRAHRLGQERTVTVYRLITEGTVDEKIHEISQDKLRLNDLVLEDGQRGASTREDEGAAGKGGSTRMMGDILAQIIRSGPA